MATTKVSLLPVRIDIDVVQETDVNVEFQLKKFDEQTQAWVAEDLSNDMVKLTVRDDFGGAIKVPTKSNGRTEHADAPNGKTRFRLTKEELVTGDRASDVKWWYEVRRVVGGTGEEVVYLYGALTLCKTVGD